MSQKGCTILCDEVKIVANKHAFASNSIKAKPTSCDDVKIVALKGACASNLFNCKSLHNLGYEV